MTARTKRKGLRDALSRRKSRVEHFDIPLEDSDVIDEIAERLNVARRTSRYVDLGTDDEAKKRAADNLAALQTEFGACFHRLDIVGLSTPELNAVNNAYTGDEDDSDLYMTTLLVACLQGDNDLSPEEWKAEVATWPAPDKGALFAKINRACQQPFSAGIPNE